MTFDFTINVGPPDPEFFEVYGVDKGKVVKERIPNFGRLYTHRTVRNGNWSDPGVWDRGEVPGKGAVVHINHEILYDIQPGEE